MSSRASSHKAGRKSQNLPAWYQRLIAVTIKEDRDIEPGDFDQDISDLEETSNANTNSDGSACASCKCGGYSDECNYDRDNWSSRRSYDGSDADYYYQLKNEREERKQELQEIRLEKWKALDFEQQKVTEVEEAFAQLQDTCSSSDATSLLAQLAGRRFHLFCVEYVDRCYDAYLPSSTYIEFHALDEESPQPGENQPSSDNQEQIYGHVYFDANTGCDLAAFVPPKMAGLNEYTLKSFHGEYQLLVRFISNDYLILIVPHRLILEDQPPLQSAPDPFRFMGIRFDRDKETKERKARRKRSPSPRESWFERSHQIGAWGPY